MASIELGADQSVTIAGIVGWSGWSFTVRSAAAGAESVEVTAPAGEVVTADVWRRLPIGTALRAARGASKNLYIELVTASFGQALRRPYGGSPEHDAQVVRLYRAALSQGLAPSEVVADHFEVNAKTAARWIAGLRRSASKPDRPLGSYAEEAKQVGAPTLVERNKRDTREEDAQGRGPVRPTKEALAELYETHRKKTGRARTTNPKGSTK